MGAYINPPDMSKEEFLKVHGALLNGVPNKHYLDGRVAVCLVNNGPFTAAGICFSDREMKAFADSTNDPRPKLWFYVDEKLVEPYLRSYYKIEKEE